MWLKISGAALVVIILIVFVWLLMAEKEHSSDLGQQLSQSLRRISSLQTDLETSERNISSQRQANDRLTSENRDLMSRLSSTERELRQQQSQVNSLRNERNRFENECLDLQKQFEEAQATNVQLNERLADLEKAASSRAQELEDQKAALVSELSKDSADKAPEEALEPGDEEKEAVQEEQSSQLAQQLQERDEALAAAQAESQRLSDILAQCLKDQDNGPSSENSQIEVDGQETARIAQLEKELTDLEAERQKLLAQSEEQQKQLIDLKRNLEEARRSGELTSQNLEKARQDLKSAQGISLEELANLQTQDGGPVVYFAEGSAILTREGAEALEKMAADPTLFEDKNLLVVGHADDLPIARRFQRRFPSNWDLSAARAIAVVRYLESRGLVPSEKLAVVSHSYFQPQVPNDSAENRRRNRRVKLMLTDAGPVGTFAPPQPTLISAQ